MHPIIPYRFMALENTTKEQTSVINEFRHLANNLSIVLTNIQSQTYQSVLRNDDLTTLVNVLNSTQSDIQQIVHEHRQMFEAIKELLASTGTIKHELQEAKIQQIFQPNEQFISPQPQLPIDLSVPIGCDRVPSFEDGIYRIRASPDTDKPFYANCIGLDDTVKWTVILSRVEDDTNFFRSWSDYKNGFGNTHKSFWIGLDKIHEVRKSSCMNI